MSDALERAKQNYLLSKSALLMRQARLEEEWAYGLDTSKSKRAIQNLEASMAAHMALIEQLSSD